MNMKGLIGSILFILVLCVGFLALPIIKETIYYGRFQRYFFIGDDDFVGLLGHSRWRDTIWNPQSGSYVTVSNGIAEFYYNETTGDNWGASILFQGAYPHYGIKWLPLLIGRNEAEAKDEEFVIFKADRPIDKGNLWLETKFKVMDRNFRHDVTGDDPKGNVGLEFLASVNDMSYDEHWCVRVAVVFSGFIWNGSAFEEVSKDIYYIQRGALYDEDVHVTFWVHEISALDTWQIVKFDYGKLINKVFELLEDDGVEKLTVYGFQLYAEGIGVDVKAQFDYVRTMV